MSIWLYVLKW